jgi:hypothetical protein
VYLTRRMNELRVQDYFIRLRHYSLKGGEETKFETTNLLFLMEPSDLVTIQSEAGGFDMSAENINEQQYEHFGEVTLKNNSPALQHIRFIEIIEKREVLCP